MRRLAKIRLERKSGWDMGEGWELKCHFLGGAFHEDMGIALGPVLKSGI
jgi:hypothetical protein